MADREKEGKTKIQKFEYLKNEKSFLDYILLHLKCYLNMAGFLYSVLLSITLII